MVLAKSSLKFSHVSLIKGARNNISFEIRCSMSEQRSPLSPENVGQAAVPNVDIAASLEQPAVATDPNAEIEAAVPIEIDQEAEDSGYGDSDS
jgi:hypothetical protein